MALKHVSEYMAGAIFGMVSDPKNVGLKREKPKSCRNTSSSTQSNEDKMENEKDEYIHCSGCSDGWGHYRSQINGTCPDCGMETVDGVAVCGCNYSPVECKTCGSAPCDQSC